MHAVVLDEVSGLEQWRLVVVGVGRMHGY
jgi:hypothetical protein